MVKDANRYKECNRTQGISTTDLVGRMVRLTLTLSINAHRGGVGWGAGGVGKVRKMFTLKCNKTRKKGTPLDFLTTPSTPLKRI